MKEKVLNNVMSIVKNNISNYSEEQLEIVKYGLEGIYLFITKFILITLIAFLLGIIKEYFIFCVFYNIIRMPSFGLHATKSWICLVSSLLIFISAPYVCIIYTFSNKLIIGLICILLMFKNSPADTKYKPIINPKRRQFYKLTSTLIAILYVVFAVIIKNHFISNCLIMSLLIQCIVTSPLTYKLFNLPYGNYKEYVKGGL